jgi:hypothetical protein
MAISQFNTSGMYDDIKIDVTEICRNTGTVLNTNLQSYRDVPLKQLAKKFNFDQIPDEYFDTTVVTENTLDKLSLRLYDNPYWWWLILLVNRIDNPFVFNMSPRLVSVAAGWLYRYEGTYTEETYFDLVNEYVQKQRTIRYVKKSFLTDFFRRMLV